jgi:hypothetical protein
MRDEDRDDAGGDERYEESDDDLGVEAEPGGAGGDDRLAVWAVFFDHECAAAAVYPPDGDDEAFIAVVAEDGAFETAEAAARVAAVVGELAAEVFDCADRAIGGLLEEVV